MWRGQEVSILEIGDEVTIDGVTSNWVKVRLWRSTTFEISPIGIVGWCFGGFLGLGL